MRNTRLNRSHVRMKRERELARTETERAVQSLIINPDPDELEAKAQRKAEYIQRMAERRRTQGRTKAAAFIKSTEDMAVGIPQTYIDAIRNKPNGIYHTGVSHPVYEAYYLGIYLGQYTNEFKPKYLIQKLHQLALLLGLENTALTVEEFKLIAEEQEQWHVVSEFKVLLAEIPTAMFYRELKGVESRIDVEPSGKDYIVKFNEQYHGLLNENKAELLYSSLLRLSKKD